MVIDSFNFILTNRRFSFDSIERAQDMELEFVRPMNNINYEEDNNEYEYDSEYEF
jgi:hypothetical protein